MKNKLLRISICFSLTLAIVGCNNGEDDPKIELDTVIQYVKDIKLVEDYIYSIGYTHEEKRSYYSLLNKYNRNYELIWSIKVDDHEVNQFDKIELLDGKIYISGVQGKKFFQNEDLSRFIYSISENGRVLDKIELGESSYSASNLIFFENCIWIGFAQKKYPSKEKTKTTIAKYNIQDKKLELFKGELSGTQPRKIFHMNSSVFLLGDLKQISSDKVMKPYLVKVDGSVVSESFIETQNFEWFINSTIDESENELNVYSMCRGIYENPERFLKITTLDTDLNIVDTKKLSFPKLGLTDLEFGSFQSANGLWLLAENNDDSFYLEIDNSSIPLRKIDLDSVGKEPKCFQIFPEEQIQLINNELKITNEHPTQYKLH